MITTKLAQPSCGALLRALPAGALLRRSTGRRQVEAATWLDHKPSFVAAWPVEYRQCGDVVVFRFRDVARLGYFVVDLPTGQVN